VQEALNNIVKHSQADQGYIKLLYDADFIYLSIQDNGKGFSLSESGSQGGHGLHNIQERVKLLGGSLDLKSDTGKGTLMQIRVPRFL
jgi:signal transduction histidine kinase